jgi:molecular chaperone DnaJ
MSEKRDYYEVLGLARDCSPDEIRKAYKQAALKHHPDRNPNDASAEQKFKEASEAYSVLSDEQKRATYDRFGHAGLGGGSDFSGAGVNDILNHFQDMFSDFFGGMGGPFGGGGGHSSRGRRRPDRGHDVRIEVELTLEDAMRGCKREVPVRGRAPCDDCKGSGAQAGSAPQPCTQCRGTGQVTAQRGFIMFSTPCARCGGSGTFIANPCGTCRGQGLVERQRRVIVTFPAGIDSGQRLRVPNQGMPGPGETPPGDLYVDVQLRPDERFERQGDTLGTRLRVSFTTASLGGKAELELPDDTRVSVDIEPGTQPGSVIVVRGKGMPRLDRSGRGELHVLVDLAVPTKLSKQAKKLLKELEEELGDSEAEAYAS